MANSSHGEREKGKLGHGNRISYDRPKLMETLLGIEIVNMAAGGAHSAAISADGRLYTWGKGRYGRLGHNDSEDQLKPKMVQLLKHFVVVDVACGSGDAQSLCVTSDGNVWSWGDGDYGKLGRGGSEGCKIPIKIDSLFGKEIVKVECGSQFSVALSATGLVYTWGKGDYHRLGHGVDEHVRKPRVVAGLEGKKVISIACGSLHCVACTSEGVVYTWGDNDEGQLGDATTTAVGRPRLVNGLMGKMINRVACGSAHSLAWSTTKASSSGDGCGFLPPSIPVEYVALQNLPIPVLRDRLILLSHFSELFCHSIPLMNLHTPLFDKVRYILVSTVKESCFKKIVHTTMVREKQHGPVIEVNRLSAASKRTKKDPSRSVLAQVCQKMDNALPEHWLLPQRVWKVKLVGESVDDCGGGYSESVAEICEELNTQVVQILIPSPSNDSMVFNPLLADTHPKWLKFVGSLFGISVRTGSPLNLCIHETMWKQITGEQLTIDDLTDLDKDTVTSLVAIQNMSEEALVAADIPFAIASITGGEPVTLSKVETKITYRNKNEYLKAALSFRLEEFKKVIELVRSGLSQVVPLPFISLFTACELESIVCGNPEISVSVLKSIATYKGVEPTSPLMVWFWQVMEEFSNSERSLFLRFVWGRARLPRSTSDFRGRDFVIQILDKYSPPDQFLPEAYTCFFLLKMPRYSCKSVLKEKLTYAIHFCKSIDIDDYARVALSEQQMMDSSSDDDEYPDHRDTERETVPEGGEVSDCEVVLDNDMARSAEV